jgi:hypothetical protein
MNRRQAVFFAIGIAALGAPARARATPRPLPFTYTTETLATGDLEVEQFADLTPVKALGLSGNPVWYLGTQFQTEFEYGITDRLELGLYIVYVPTPAGYIETAPMTEVTGAKERLRYVFADPGEWPIDVGVYGELVEGDTEAELEAKILLQRRIGKLRIDTNLWAEYELNYASPAKDIVLNPTLGATYEIAPAVHVGAEGWMRVEFTSPATNPRPPIALGPVGYVGPAVLFNFGKLWWSTGIYARVTQIDYTMQAGDPYGPVWIRTIIGLNL